MTAILRAWPRRATLLLAALAAVITALAVTTPAQAVTIAHVYTEFGHHYFVGAADLSAGSQVTQENGPGRTITFHDVGYDNNGFPQYRITFSNGNNMAANTACDGITIKSDASAFGTVFIIYLPGDGHLYLVPRGCNNGDYDKRMGGNNQLNDQWEVRTHGTSGFYEKLVIQAN